MDKKNKKRIINISFNISFALLTLIVMVVFTRKEVVGVIMLSVLAVVGLVKWRSKVTLFLFIFIAAFAMIIEGIGVYFNVWGYSPPTLFIIPLWMFVAWGNAAVFIHQMAIEIKKMRRDRLL